MMPDSLRKIFTRSSGVLARPFSWIAKNILFNLVELRAARRTGGFEFGTHDRQCLTDRAPFVEERLQLGEGGGVAGFGEKIGDIFHRNLFDVAEGIDGSLGFLSGEVFLDFDRLFRKLLQYFDFGGTVAELGKRVA